MSILIPLAQILKVKPKETIRFLLMPLGTRVKKDDLLARKTGFLGKKIEVRAEVDGKLASLSSETGELLIESEGPKLEFEKSKEVKVETAGKQATLKHRKKPRSQKPEERGESREVKSSVLSEDSVPSVSKPQCFQKDSAFSVLGFFGFGKGEGELLLVEDCLEFTQINKDFEEKVIFAPSLTSAACLFKASALQVAAVVVGFVEDFENIKREITGKVDLGFLVLEGDQDEKMTEKLMKKIKKWEGKRVRVEGDKKIVTLLHC